MRENERYCQHLPAGVDKVASPSHVKCLMWPQLDLSRELLGFHTHFKSRSVRIALCFSIILSSGNTPPKLSSCEFSSVITPETRAFGPEEDEPADTPPPAAAASNHVKAERATAPLFSSTSSSGPF